MLSTNNGCVEALYQIECASENFKRTVKCLSSQIVAQSWDKWDHTAFLFFNFPHTFPSSVFKGKKNPKTQNQDQKTKQQNTKKQNTTKQNQSNKQKKRKTSQTVTQTTELGQP